MIGGGWKMQKKNTCRFDDVIEVYIVYISEFDIFKEGKTIYHVEKVLKETGTVVDDGLHEIFVNTTIDDGSIIAYLMNCFTSKEVNNTKFPKFSKRVKELKTTEGGANAMCELMEKYLIQQLVELVKEGLLKVADAARKANMSEEEFRALLNK